MRLCKGGRTFSYTIGKRPRSTHSYVRRPPKKMNKTLPKCSSFERLPSGPNAKEELRQIKKLIKRGRRAAATLVLTSIELSKRGLRGLY